MRLIDADKFEGFIRKKYADIEKAEDIKEQMLFDLSYQPTAYDPDKVVEQLEEAEHNARTMIVFEKAYGSVDDRIKAEAEARALKHAIEIVNGEYVTEQSCEWKLEDSESNLYVTACENRQLIFEGTPEENGYKYCPYCGRKIKRGGELPEKGVASKRGNPAG